MIHPGLTFSLVVVSPHPSSPPEMLSRLSRVSPDTTGMDMSALTPGFYTVAVHVKSNTVFHMKWIKE
jgi:hypothetical protein